MHLAHEASAAPLCRASLPTSIPCSDWMQMWDSFSRPWTRSATALPHHHPHRRTDRTDRKHNVTTSHQQLQELEARLRETEERLAKVSRGNSPSRPADAGAITETDTAIPTSRKQLHPSDRPQAAPREDTQTLASNTPGGMPPPTSRQYSAAGSDYVVVDRSGVERPQQPVR